MSAGESGTRRQTLADLHSDLLDAVESLELHERFIVVDGSAGLATPVLWRLRSRLAGVLVLNFAGLWGLDSYRGDILANTLDMCRQLYQDRDVERLAHAMVGASAFTETAKASGTIQAQLKEAMTGAPPEFFNLQAKICGDWRQGEQAPALEALAPLEATPAILAVGSHSPAAFVKEATARLQQLLPGSQVADIPESNQWWQVEGPEQLSAVPSVLTWLLRRVCRAGEFSVLLDRSGGQALGVDVDSSDGSTLVVTGVQDTGLFSEWNAKHPYKRVLVGDRITNVNGRCIDVKLIVAECQRHRVLNMTVHAAGAAPPQGFEDRFLVAIDRSRGEQLGIVMSEEEGVTLRIEELREEGLFADWNAKNPSKSVVAGDFIVNVNGICGDPLQLMAECKMHKLLVMTVQPVEDTGPLPAPEDGGWQELPSSSRGSNVLSRSSGGPERTKPDPGG